MSEENKRFVTVEIDGAKVEKEAIEKQTGFDGMSGEPIIELSVQTGFDGMSGQPVYSAIEPAGFDAMTGKQVYKVVSSGSKNGATPNTSVKSGVKVPIIIGSVVAVVLLLAVGAFAAVKSGIFMTKQQKILKACYDTMAEDTFGSTLIGIGDILSSEKVTTTIDGKVGYSGVNADMKITSAVDTAAPKLYGSANVKVSGVVDQTFEGYMDDSVIDFAMPDVNDKVYEYDFTKKNDGALADAIEDYTKGDIEDVNDIFVGFTNLVKAKSSSTAATNKALLKVVNDIEVENIDAEEFEINDKDVKCKGYKVTIADKDIEALADELEDAQSKDVEKNVEMIIDAISNLSGEDVKVSEIKKAFNNYDKLKDLADEMDDIEFNIYLYKGKLAAITVEEDVDFELLFQGGDNRTSNMELRVKEGSETVKIKKKSSIKDNKEKGTISAQGEEIEYSYDKKSGKYSLKFPGGSYDGKFLVDKGKISTAFDIYEDGVDLDLKIEIAEGCRISKPKGKIFDIGSADEDDFEDEIDELQDDFEDISKDIMSNLYGYAPAATAEDWYDDYAAPATEETLEEEWDY